MSAAPTDPFNDSAPEDVFNKVIPTHFEAADYYSPSFYNPTATHPAEKRSELVVSQNGVPIGVGFTISEVAPWCWWAIDKYGEVMEQSVFEQFYERWTAEHYKNKNVPMAMDMSKHPVPRVEVFVNQRICPDRPHCTEPITRDSTAPVVVTAQYDQDGEKVAVDLSDPKTQELWRKNGWVPASEASAPDGLGSVAMAEMRREIEELKAERTELLANQKKKPGRKPNSEKEL